MNTSFRLDVNALRALAVIGVVAYHFDLGVLPGGFAGVDVFFVVSGFLMTRIIAGRLAAGRFSLTAFYAARARRIVPALLVVVLAVGVLGALVLNPLRLTTLSQDSLSSLLFVSNILYLKQGGYFATSANENWLLHTWSLSLEWQFYLVFPLLLMGLRRAGLGRRTTIAVLSILLLLSFVDTVFAHFTGGGTQDAAFYLLPARAWEFLVGALCAFATPSLARSRWRQAAHYAGVVAIVATMMLLDAKAVWPSAVALLPVGGTALVLVGEQRDAPWARVAPIRSVGLWSYSIYLWHWPIAAALSSLGAWSLPSRCGGIAASLGLAYLSYVFVETRAAAFVWAARRRLVTIGAPAFALPLGFALATMLTHGLEILRYNGQPALRAELADYRAAMGDWGYPDSCAHRTVDATGFSICSFGDPKARAVLVVGDSFAEQIVPRFAGTRPDITFVTRSGCSLLPGVDRLGANTHCARWNEAAYEFAAREKFKRIVFVGAWLSYAQDKLCLLDQTDCGSALDPDAFEAALGDGFGRMAARWRGLAQQGKEIVALDIMPFGDGNPTALYKDAIGGHPVESRRVSLAAFEAHKTYSTARLARAAAAAGATLIDPADFLCADGSCPIVENGRTLFMDEYHLRASIMPSARFAFLDRWLVAKQTVWQAAN